MKLSSIFIEGFLGGFAAFLMPCIYPMLPLTMSFFSKQSGTRLASTRLAIFYGLSIIFIYVVFGATLTAFLGPSALNELASGAVFNLMVFFLLVAFAISFFGVFEINLPSSLVNRIDSASGAGSLLGIFFMAFTLSLVSFSCTAGIIGTLLVEAVRSKQYLALITGMAGFSTALALPFTLAAIFPQSLARLPRSGAWLNSVKVVLGFLELALSLKFLSSFDLAYHAGLLGRETFLSVWIALFLVLTLYLLGKIRLAHDAPLEHVPVFRLLLALMSFAFAIYLVPGLVGAPLKALSGFLPPLSRQEFSIGGGGTAQVGLGSRSVLPARRYTDILHEPLGLQGFFTFSEAKAYAVLVKKPLLIDFTGHSCVNCRKMEATVWADPTIRQLIDEKFVLVSLYVDERTPLPDAEQYTSKIFGSRVTTLGNMNADLEASLYNTNSQPFYVIAGHDGEELVKPEQFNASVLHYASFLANGLKAYAKKYP